MVGTCLRCSLRIVAGRFLLLPALLLAMGLSTLGADDPAPSKPKLPDALGKPAPANTEDLKAIQKQVRTVLDKVMPAVVSVRIGMASGSAVIVSADGYVLTAGHVSGEPNRTCTLIFPDGKQVKAKSLGSNRTIDSGLLKITEEGKWPHVNMGSSADLYKGQWCITVGHPGGFKPGRTPVVRLGRIQETTDNYIRTDCTIVGGDSGGPLFDMEGKVIGIHSRIGNSITANIHVPIDTFRENWERLTKGEVWPVTNTAYLGVELDKDGPGCKIAKVVENTPAAKAELKPGDVILEMEGKKVANMGDLSGQLRTKKPGDQVTFKVQRDDETLTLKVTLGKRPPRDD